MSKLFKILVSGGGVTGPVVAFWLARASTSSKPIHITVVERASSVLKSGQGIDIEGPAREVVSRMGLLDKIKSRTTCEQGFCCIDNNNRSFATFVLTDAIKDEPNVELQYERQITEVVQTNDLVRVTIAKDDGQSYVEEYDAVIASDGTRSKTRDLMPDRADTRACIKPRDMFTAFFSIPSQPQDRPYSRFQHSLGGRSVIIRPVTEKFTSVYLIAVGAHPALTKSLGARDQKARWQAWAETFSDVHYEEFPRVLREMQETDNFYSDQISQVKLPRWHKGRCALVGDAAYAPSPITGQGTQLAVLGGYVLAGELAANLSDPARAFEEYDKKLRGYVEQAQQVPLGGNAPHIFNPQTWWGIYLLQTAFWLVAATKVTKLIPDLGEMRYALPDYQFR